MNSISVHAYLLPLSVFLISNIVHICVSSVVLYWCVVDDDRGRSGSDGVSLVRECGSGMVSDSGNLWWDNNERINEMTDLETIINTQCHSKIFYFYYFVGAVKQMSFQASTSTVLTNPNYNQSHECHMTITWWSRDLPSIVWSIVHSQCLQLSYTVVPYNNNKIIKHTHTSIPSLTWLFLSICHSIY